MERGLIEGRSAEAAHSCARPHDLLRVTRLVPADDEPDWVREAFVLAPWVVVRRAAAAEARCIPVGVRGIGRAQRFGAVVHDEDVESIHAPESLLNDVPSHERRTLPAFAALAGLRAAPYALDGYVWGPTGSTGFELVTGVPAVSASSDLDLLVRLPERPSSAAIRALADTLAHAAERAGLRIDAQLETPAGGVALAELASGAPRVLARTSEGPRLVADPWCLA